MNEHEAGVLSSSTAAPPRRIASALARGDEGARAEAASARFSKSVETAGRRLLALEGLGLCAANTIVGLKAGSGRLLGCCRALKPSARDSDFKGARVGSGGTVSCSDCPPCRETNATAHRGVALAQGASFDAGL